MVFLLGSYAPHVRGQGFLDQMEKKPRWSRPNDAANKNGEVDKGASTPSAETAGPERAAYATTRPTPAQTLGNGSSSILEAPALPSARSPVALRRRRLMKTMVFTWGLEAESVIGGGIGARVLSITENSPAWRAGFKANDIILAIDGFAISNLDTMVDRLALRRPGDTIKVLLLRGTRNVELTAVFAEYFWSLNAYTV